jgi:hypothetical protein
MNKMHYAWIGLLSVLALIVAATGLVDPVTLNATLPLDIAWWEGFTAHADGIALATAGAAAVPEVVAEAAKQLRSEMETIAQSVGAKLSKNLTEQITDLDVRIKAGETYAADLKEKSARMSEDNARFVAEIESRVKGYVEGLNAQFEATQKAGRGGIEVVDYGALIAAEVQKAGFGSADAGRRVKVDFKTWPSRRKDVSVSGADVYAPAYVPGIISCRRTGRETIPYTSRRSSR